MTEVDRSGPKWTEVDYTHTRVHTDMLVSRYKQKLKVIESVFGANFFWKIYS